MTVFHEWAARWNIPHAALVDLRHVLNAGDGAPATDGFSEAAVQTQVRLEASHVGARLWRNNVGAMQDESGRVVRYGLANESPAMNKVIKSGDLIGVRPVLVTPAHVGTTIGQFVSREIKPSGWRYTGTDREVAQMGWATLINTLGGDACFANATGTLK